MTRWMSARQAAEHLGYGADRRGVKALFQATYRIPALRASIVDPCGSGRGLRFDRERLDAYFAGRQVDQVAVDQLVASAPRRRRPTIMTTPTRLSRAAAEELKTRWEKGHLPQRVAAR